MRARLASLPLAFAISMLACGKGGGTGGSGGATSSSSSGTGGSTMATGGGGAATTSSSTGGAGGMMATGGGGAGTGGAMGCGIYEGDNYFNCSPDGNGRGKCDNGTLVYETCDRGCLIEPVGQDDICMGTTNTWSCSGSYGKAKVEDGDYYATEFGCWTDGNGNVHTDPGDNCIPTCISQAQSDGLCAGLDGPTCEETVNWYAADGARFGCLARLRVTNPANGKAVVVVALDYGPACSVEDSVSHAIIDLSGAANEYLFGGPQGASDMTTVHVVEVSKSTPLGPVN
jgi:hypothetical protein